MSESMYTTAYKPSDLMTHFIQNMLTGETKTFNTLPDDVTETYSTSWDMTDIRGRSAPYIGYSGNEARSVSYSITLQEDMCDDMMGVVKFLKGLVYPKYYGSLVDPPYCVVKLGGMVDSMTAVVNSVSVSWEGPILGDDSSTSDHYSRAEISLDFTELRNRNIPTADLF